MAEPQQETWLKLVVLTIIVLAAAAGLSALKADEDPDRLSFVHAVRVIRRKIHRFPAIPPWGEGRVP